MALKDWKKVEDGYKNKQQHFLRIRKTIGNEYEVVVLNRRRAILSVYKYFETKKAALKFAKSYMRTH